MQIIIKMGQMVE